MEEEYFTVTHPMVGRRVMYDGDNRINELGGSIGIVSQVKVGRDGKQTWAVSIPGIRNLVYAASWAWAILPEDDDIKAIAEIGPFEGPHASALEAIHNEIHNLTNRINELEAAKKVLESL